MMPGELEGPVGLDASRRPPSGRGKKKKSSAYPLSRDGSP